MVLINDDCGNPMSRCQSLFGLVTSGIYEFNGIMLARLFIQHLQTLKK